MKVNNKEFVIYSQKVDVEIINCADCGTEILSSEIIECSITCLCPECYNKCQDKDSIDLMN